MQSCRMKTGKENIVLNNKKEAIDLLGGGKNTLAKGL